jgi:hypothetical protein
MRKLVPLLFAFFVAAACGASSSSSSLQGAGSFTPNAVNALKLFFPDGGIEQDFVGLSLTNTTPAFTCAFLDAGYPDSGIFEGEVALFIGQSPTIKAGTMSITDDNTFFFGSSPPYPETGIAFIGLSGPTIPPGNQALTSSGSISGTLTLTKVGGDWAESFSATMIGHGGQSPLSGAFDTSSTCYYSTD